MNTGSLMITFVIGGIMLISILAFNVQVMNNSQEVTLNTLLQSNLDNLVEILENDFNRIGFNSGTAQPFKAKGTQNVIFQSDVYEDDTFPSMDIRWYFDTSDPVSNTSNPNDYYLKRRGPIGTSTFGTLEFPVVYFYMNYYTSSGSTAMDMASISKIEVEIMVESGEGFSTGNGNKEYPRLVWKRVFVPNNINLPY